MKLFMSSLSHRISKMAFQLFQVCRIPTGYKLSAVLSDLRNTKNQMPVASVLMCSLTGAFETLNRMGLTHDLVVVTSRQHVIQDATLEWIDRHYGGLFQEVYFGNHFALEGVSRKKSDICK